MDGGDSDGDCSDAYSHTASSVMHEQGPEDSCDQLLGVRVSVQRVEAMRGAAMIDAISLVLAFYAGFCFARVLEK